MTALRPPQDPSTDNSTASDEHNRELVFAIRAFEEADQALINAGEAIEDALRRQRMMRQTRTLAEQVLAAALNNCSASFEGRLYRGSGKHVDVENCQLVIPLDRSRR